MKTVIEMAREADLYLDGENLQQPLWVLSDKELEHFAELVRADEREACAKVCDDLPPPDGYNRTEISVWDVASLECADAIRARSNT